MLEKNIMKNIVSIDTVVGVKEYKIDKMAEYSL